MAISQVGLCLPNASRFARMPPKHWGYSIRRSDPRAQLVRWVEMLVRKLMFLVAAIALPLGSALLMGGELRESMAGAYCSALAIGSTRPLLWIAGLVAGLVSRRWTTLVAMTIAAFAISLFVSPAFDAVGITGDAELIVARLNILVIAAFAGCLLRDLLAPSRVRSALRERYWARRTSRDCPTEPT